MRTIANDTLSALLLANLDCRYTVFEELDATRLSVETTRYAATKRVLADAGLVLWDANADDSMTLARVARATRGHRGPLGRAGYLNAANGM
jgi:hypothetical protein